MTAGASLLGERAPRVYATGCDAGRTRTEWTATAGRRSPESDVDEPCGRAGRVRPAHAGCRRGRVGRAADQLRRAVGADPPVRRGARARRASAPATGSRAHPQHPDFPRAYFAVLSLGAVVVPVHALLVAREIAYVLTDSGAKLLICAGPLLEQGASRRRAGRGQPARGAGRRGRRPPRRAGDRRRTDRLLRERASPRTRGDPLHLGHHRRAQGRGAHPPQPGDERRSSRPTRPDICPRTT